MKHRWVSTMVGATLAWGAMVAPVGAQWKVEPLDEADDQEITHSAVVRSESGESLSLYVGEDDTVRAELALGDGLVKLDSDGCPTYRIDDGKSIVASRLDGDCGHTPARLLFDLGVVEGDSVRSEALLDIMNGSRLDFYFRLDGLGYQRATFSLRGSKQAILKVLDDKAVIAQ